MARKSVLPSYSVFSSQSLASSFDNFSNPTHVEYFDNMGVLLGWTGSSPVGEIKIWVSNDKGNTNPAAGDPPTNWYQLDFGSAISISGASGSHLININQVPFTWLAIEYVRASGSGSLSAKLAGKSVGA